MGLTAAVSGGIAGAPLLAVLIAALMTLVTGFTGYALARAGDSLSRGIPVIAWIITGFLAIILTGGGASPLIVLLLAAPLAALLAGALRMAAEAGIFAAAALFCVFVATLPG
ncbi:MAG TPA: hypothetical protein DCY26_13590, partial [Hyphomonas sp.]|nr:hypothetical protein [Hyphomonas sp.]